MLFFSNKIKIRNKFEKGLCRSAISAYLSIQKPEQILDEHNHTKNIYLRIEKQQHLILIVSFLLSATNFFTNFQI